MCWSLLLIKNFKETFFEEETQTQVFFCEHCLIFKITCLEEYLQTAASTRCYFDIINLKQSGFCATFFLKKILVSGRKYKNNLKTKKSCGFPKILKVKICVFQFVFSSHSENTELVTRDHAKSSQMRNETPLKL